MKPFCLIAAIACATPAFALQPGISAAGAPRTIHDWSGPYVGLTYGQVGNSDMTNLSNQFTFSLNEGSIAGAQAGYLVQSGALVFGGEVAFADYRGTPLNGVISREDSIRRGVDLKGRFGYAADRFMVYGVVGYSFGDAGFVNGLVNPPVLVKYDLSGLAYGVGIDYAVSDRLTLGVEYMERKFHGASPGGGYSDIDMDVSTLGLRLALTF